MLTAVMCRVRLAAGALCISLVVSACAHHQVNKQHYLNLPVERSLELLETPFFPQDAYQCGPASLATVLNFQGVEVSPQQLQALVYLPERKGSLQAEMLAAAAHYGRLAVRIPPSMDSLLLELSSGNPVVVLQNLGLGSLPVWHYAVAIGYDLEKDEIYLRSGKDKRRAHGFRVFLKTWSRSNYWAMLVVSPGTVPVSATEKDYLTAASALERRKNHDAALQAFEAASRRWPDNYLAWAGTGNAAFSLSRFSEAEQAYRQALRLKPDRASIMNNLALALTERGCKQTALSVMECAVEHAPDDANLAASYNEIKAFSPGAESCQRFFCGQPGLR
ncbi:MAG: PA2778 family cysteine peptidase [Pseudomonadota bacterium]|nr:PA2778 family cysteine peptidase [Pseudomonadota bacterium]